MPGSNKTKSDMFGDQNFYVDDRPSGHEHGNGFHHSDVFGPPEKHVYEPSSKDLFDHIQKARDLRCRHTGYVFRPTVHKRDRPGGAAIFNGRSLTNNDRRPLIAADFTLREDIKPSDRSRIFKLLNAGGFFTTREIAYAMNLLDRSFLGSEAGDFRFMLLEEKDALLGYACYGLLPLCKDRYHIYWMAVDPGAPRQRASASAP